MTRRPFLVGFFLLVIALPLFAGELPQVLAPNTTAYSAEQVAVLTQTMETLEDTLSDDSLGSRKTFVTSGWHSRDFAIYTVARLSEFGYDVMLVSRSDWLDAVSPEASHVWVLVGIPLAGKTAWVPVEATPEPGEHQKILGRIPSFIDADGNLCFETSYVSPSEVFEQPSNLPPIAKIILPFRMRARKELTFWASGSYDPDGEIVLYQWDFGGEATKVATAKRVRHQFEQPGVHTITLTVIDNGGMSTKTSVTRRLSISPAGGCSTCGG